MESPSGVMDEEEEDEENKDRTIYPWMKKIHVAGVGELIHLRRLRILRKKTISDVQ